jgi:hypothetical protein
MASPKIYFSKAKKKILSFLRLFQLKNDAGGRLFF